MTRPDQPCFRPLSRILPAALAASLATAQPGLAEAPPPPYDVLVMLARTTMVAVNQANQTGNYSVLHALASPRIQKKLDEKSLGQALAGFRQRKIDLSPAVLVAPQFVQPPGVDADGVLSLMGVFPTQPRQIRFSLGFRLIDGHWRIEAFNVDTPPNPTGPAPSNTAAGPRVAQGDAGNPPAPSGASYLDMSTDPPTTTRY
jgi:hypothetical protein